MKNILRIIFVVIIAMLMFMIYGVICRQIQNNSVEKIGEYQISGNSEKAIVYKTIIKRSGRSQWEEENILHIEEGEINKLTAIERAREWAEKN